LICLPIIRAQSVTAHARQAAVPINPYSHPLAHCSQPYQRPSSHLSPVRKDCTSNFPGRDSICSQGRCGQCGEAPKSPMAPHHVPRLPVAWVTDPPLGLNTRASEWRSLISRVRAGIIKGSILPVRFLFNSFVACNTIKTCNVKPVRSSVSHTRRFLDFAHRNAPREDNLQHEPVETHFNARVFLAVPSSPRDSTPIDRPRFSLRGNQPSYHSTP
jgi:hypothetical protein